ncbi:unnamed protein product, partial [Owenia fusiformis]
EWGTIIQRYKGLFNSQTMSDVQFSFGASKGPTVYAHKVILGAASDVLKSMFYGDLKETTDVIDIPDISMEIFLEIMRFIYYGEVNLTPENVMGIFYATKKYLVPGLGEKCRKYLDESIDPDNVCTILYASLNFDEEPLKKNCLDMIAENAEDVLASDAFLNCSNEVLGLVLDQDKLGIQSEVDVFLAVEKWAKEACKKHDLPVTGDNMREMIGDDLYKLRLLDLTPEELGKHISPTDILKPLEIKDILECITIGKQCANPKFNTKTREKFNEKECRRFTICTTCIGTFWNCPGDSCDALTFTADKAIILTGLGVFVPYQATTYKFTASVQVLDKTNKVLYDVKHAFTQDDVLMGDTVKKIVFDKKIEVNSKDKYSIKIWLKRPGTYRYRSYNMYSPVTVDNVTFTFSNHPASGNGTDAIHVSGQLPCLYFKR